MKIKYAIGINWGNLTRNVFPFESGLNLLVGDTGSGKSTLMDLIQAVMTVDHNELINYNAGQSEVTTKKKTKRYRTYAAYLLGADQFQFTREEAIGITACVFEDKDGETITAWVLGHAEVQGSGENRKASGGVESYGICMGHALEVEDFIKVNTSGETEVKDVEDLHRHLKNSYNINSEVFHSRKEYLVRLYASFSGLTSISYPEAVKRAKAFVNHIYPTQTDDVHKFVKNELLEKIDLSNVIKNLQEILRSYSNIQAEAERIKQSKNSLEKIIISGENLISSWHQFYDENYLYYKRKEYRTLKKIDELGIIKEKSIFTLKQLERRFKKYELKEKALTEEQLTLASLSSKNDAVKEKKHLNKELLLYQKEQKSLELKLEEALRSFKVAANSLSIANEVTPLNKYSGASVIHKLEQTLAIEDKDSKIATLSSLIKSINNFVSEGREYYKALRFEEDESRSEISGIQRELNTINGMLDKYRSTGKSSYPNQDDIDTLNRLLPEAKARPICELIDIKDTKWQQAIEGFMGGARFTIVVDQDYESEAAEIMLKEKRRSKIAQGSKLLSDMKNFTREVKSNSIINLMSFESEITRAFMHLNYGNVLQIETTEELRYTRRGLMKKGLGASGYTMFQCLMDRRSCFIGEKSKAERYKYIANESKELSLELNKIEHRFNLVAGARKHIESIALLDPSDAYGELVDCQTKLDGIEQKMKSLNLEKEEEITNRFSEIETELSAIKEELQGMQQEIVKLNIEITEIGGKIDTLSSNIDELKSDSDKIKNIINSTAQNTNKTEYISELNKEAKQTFKNEDTPASFNDITKDLFYLYKHLIEDHNRECVHSAKVAEAPENINSGIEIFQNIINLYSNQAVIFDEIRNNILIKKLENLEKQREAFDTSFKQEFCNRIYYAIQEGRNRLERIRTMLKRHRFGDEGFDIKYKFVAELEPIYEYLQYLALENEGALGHSGELPEEHIEAKENIEKLLLSDDQGKSLKELFRYADYRNYREYDIHKIINSDEKHSISLNKLATDSGGQATTSYYIIRSIAAYAAFDKGNPRNKKDGLGLLLIDEAFNRVDDRRPGAILDYMMNELGFQIISAMPPQNEGVFAKHISARYEIFKEIINPNYSNYKVAQHAQYSVMNTKSVSELLEADTKRIQLKMELLDE